MRPVTYTMGVSLDGYVEGPDGTFDWTAPDQELFDVVTEEIRGVGVHLLGRRLYEAMLPWETEAQDPDLGFPTDTWAGRYGDCAPSRAPARSRSAERPWPPRRPRST